MRILIYGFGRMGLTHFTILNSINENLKFTIIEPNRFLLSILNKNFPNVNFLKDDSSLKEPYDISLITAPPFAHLKLLKKCLKRGDKKVFIEKPFGGYTNIYDDYLNQTKNLYVGYVLRFNPCIQWIKNKISKKNIFSVKGQFLSSTLNKRPVGWRNGPFSGVLNEVGSHVIDLIQYITECKSMEVNHCKIQSVISDVDDILDAELISNDGVNISLHFNWVKKNIRKPVFKLEIVMKDGLKYLIDQQEIVIRNNKEEKSDKISVTDIAETVPFYLRGIDFSKQMEDLLNDCSTIASVEDGLQVNKVINKIMLHEGNFRR
tara:strand:+ start:8243 stop:9199 length:957 start_codon:yes stop_codon:yes gene_type:complete